jgi:hypothetical protein
MAAPSPCARARERHAPEQEPRKVSAMRACGARAGWQHVKISRSSSSRMSSCMAGSGASSADRRRRQARLVDALPELGSNGRGHTSQCRACGSCSSCAPSVGRRWLKSTTGRTSTEPSLGSGIPAASCTASVRSSASRRLKPPSTSAGTSLVSMNGPSVASETVGDPTKDGATERIMAAPGGRWLVAAHHAVVGERRRRARRLTAQPAQCIHAGLPGVPELERAGAGAVPGAESLAHTSFLISSRLRPGRAAAKIAGRDPNPYGGS